MTFSNRHLSTIIINPMTTKSRNYPTRVTCRFQGKPGQIVLDQLRTIDKARLVRRLGRIGPSIQRVLLAALAEMFAE
ncbi:MAG: type II toxin-antitoxin system PemK/MazF family toxin [Thermoguttaceae bacterium]